MARRDSRGRFVRGGGKTSIVRTRRSGGAIVVRTTSSPTRRRRSGGRRGSSSTAGATVRKGAAIGGFALGYIKANHPELLDKVPKLKGSALLTIAAGMHFLVKPKPGGIMDHVATASTAIAFYELGQSGLSLSGDDGASW